MGNLKPDNITLFKGITKDMADLYEKKNKDYGNTFESSCDEFGLVAPAIRLTDKMSRFKQLINNNPEVVDERIEDTLIDLANYAIMTLMWLKKNDISSN